MKTREQVVHVPVVLAVPAIGGVLVGLVLAVVFAAVLALVVCLSDFSDGTSTVPTELGSCEPFCALRTDAPQGGEQR
ncbi:hypothetical protein [Nocardia yamanashiensis]|uniref:hypothetical protein n=1 Tax=Nocardia yamanashiensis TaxID=209247 RepID=UPI000835AF2F|nr:hypothetical protein [Nocardia yamanashiensis]